MKTVSKEQLATLLKELDIVKFVTTLEDYVHIWDHTLPNHYSKAQQEYIKLARACGTTGKYI